MDNYEYKSILLETFTDLLNKIDAIPCHPKNKLLLYHRFILSKLSWHLTIADLSKTWVAENLDNVEIGTCFGKRSLMMNWRTKATTMILVLF